MQVHDLKMQIHEMFQDFYKETFQTSKIRANFWVDLFYFVGYSLG
jgi:hypothetical protein